MEKCNVVEAKRTPDAELNHNDDKFSKEAVALFELKPIPDPVVPLVDPTVIRKTAKG